MGQIGEDHLDIIKATVEDAPAISRLIGSVARFFTLQPDEAGAEDFLKTISPEAVTGYLADPRFAYFKAVDNGTLRVYANPFATTPAPASRAR